MYNDYMKTPSQAKDVDNHSIDEQRKAKNREAAARYRERNRSKVNQRMRDWREANRDKARQMSREWRNRKIANGTPEEVAAIRAAESEKTKRNQDRCRNDVFTAYGGYKCNCCGETEKMFLSIDHVNNDGAAMRKAKLYSGNGTGFYLWLRKNKFPTGFQVLCMNCQVGKHKNDGVCPHQRKV
jgi:hypothetical protein